MKADISADFHVPEKRYSGVRAQQGRVLTDADFNAAMDVVDESLTELVRALVCVAGSTDAGFGISDPEAVTLQVPGLGAIGTLDFTIAPGTFILGGRVHLLRTEQQFLAQGDWLSQQLTPEVLPAAPVAGRNDLVFLESIVQPVRAVEDREFQERALGNSDTTSRQRPQMRVRVMEDSPDECATAATALRALLAGANGVFSDDGTELLSNARLEVRFTDDGPVADPCAPHGVAGYLGAENHTLRIMLTAPDAFVWNYDHGGEYYRVTIDAAAGEIVFVTTPRDPVLYPRAGQVIEILPWDVLLPNREKAAAPTGHRAVLTGEYHPTLHRIAYDGTMPAHWQSWLDVLPPSALRVDADPARFFYARVWQAPEGGGTSQATANAVALPGTGLELDFDGGGFAGDYWTLSLRTDEPTLILPMALARSGGAPPIGPRRFYAGLGIIGWDTDPDGDLAGEVSDCRNRFKRLCQVKGCCTYQVGDGHSTFGDFNSIQEAVDALSAAGGEICLLPGRHEGPVDLTGATDLVIHGCGPRSVVAAPEGTFEPVFRLEASERIVMRDFRIETQDRLAVLGTMRCRNIRLHQLGILVTGSAVAFTDGTMVEITDCSIRSRARETALQQDDIALQGPLVFLRGEQLLLDSTRVAADMAGNRNLMVPGGVQIGGDTHGATVRDCLIRGGNGNGITLGSILAETPDGGFGILIDPWITIDDDGCVKIAPPGTVRPVRDPDGGRPPRIRSQGDLSDIEIRHNRIEDHGASGISVAHWFIAEENTLPEDLDDIEIEDMVIADNRILRCLLLDLTGSLPLGSAFASGFGGITLSAVTDLQIENNDIRDGGGQGRSPFCGIYLRFVARTRITGNRIFDNGRPATLQDPLLVGSIGGIVITHVEGQADGYGIELRETPAVFIKDNTVISQEGRALDLTGNGQMLVEGNAFTAHGNNSLLVLILSIILPAIEIAPGLGLSSPVGEGQFRALIAQIAGSAVAIVNTGVNPNTRRALGMSTVTNLRAAAPAPAAPAAPAASNTGAWLVSNPRREDPREPEGTVMFNDNLVVFDALSPALTLSFCSVAILSQDCIGMHDNHCLVDTAADVVLANALVFGLVSTRVQGNRFRETLRRRGQQDSDFIPMSAVTLGLLNATENNQGTHCFLRIGWKKPRVIDPHGERRGIRLDTNRHVLNEHFCARYDEITHSYGD
jgi:hypothetical protein